MIICPFVLHAFLERCASAVLSEKCEWFVDVEANSVSGSGDVVVSFRRFGKLSVRRRGFFSMASPEKFRITRKQIWTL